MSVSFTFLGTCAADFASDKLEEIKDRFDLDYRRASCALLDGKYLIDCGPHCLDSLRIANVNVSDIENVIITHTHPDHFDINSLTKIAKDHKVTLYIREDAVIPEIQNVNTVYMKTLEMYKIDCDLTVTGLPANHSELAYPRHLYFEYKGKKIYYALDGGWLTNTEYGFIFNRGLDLLVLDCTVGDYNGDYRIGEHNSIPMLRIMIPSLKTVGAVNENTRIMLSHFARTLHKSHKEIELTVKEFGAEPAYDGLTINL